MNKWILKFLVLLLALACAVFTLFGQSPPTPALAAAKEPPRIDGALDDPCWAQALLLEDFRTARPDFGRPASEATRMLFAYDARNLYFGFLCSDREPERIKASLAKRDGIGTDDSVCVILDASGDRQNAVALFVNPLGVQMDGMIAGDGHADLSYDLVWQSAGRRSGDGYVVEIAVPLKNLRFPFRPELAVGLMGFRSIGRKSEEDYCPEYNPKNGPFLSQLRPVRISGIEFDRTFEAIPAFTFSQGSSRAQSAWAAGVRQSDLSLTGKLGLTSNLTLDATVNPDFSQVEADAGQIDVNLRYALYYTEKRPFFLEGLENFSLACSLEQSPLAAVVHTRTIVDPRLGLKLTGKLGAKDQISAIAALDEYPTALPGGVDRDALFAILRYKRLLGKDDYIGAFYTGRDWNGSANRVGGFDGRFRLTNKATLEAFALGSRTKDGAPAARQGQAVGLKYSFSSRESTINLGYFDIGRDFRTDVGYLTRTGLRMLAGFINFKLYPRSKLFQRIDPYYWFKQTYDGPSGLFETQNYLALRAILPRQTAVRIMAGLGNEVFAGRRFRRDEVWLNAGSQILKQLSFQLSIIGGKAVYYDPVAPFQGQALRLAAGLQFQPTKRLDTGLDVSYTDFHRASDGGRVYEYTILRSRTTFQVNRYLFFRGLFEYNVFHKRLTADLLASFTYIPGTVLYAGYGSAFDRIRWDDGTGFYRPAESFLQTRKTFYLKASYLWKF